MTKPPSLLQRSIITKTLTVLLCFSLLQLCRTQVSFSNINLGAAVLDPTSTGGFTISGAVANKNFANGAADTAGDINGDGYDDIIIGAYSMNTNFGEVYVVYGGPKSSTTNLDFTVNILNPLTTGFTIKGSAGGDYLGYSVSTAGDIDNDGYDDIIVGAYGKSTFQGAAYVIYGGPKSSMTNIDLSTDTLNPHTTGFMIKGASGSWLGSSVSTIGDIDKDGYDDIIIGARVQGAAYVIYGGPKSARTNFDFTVDTLDPQTTGFMIKGSAASNQLGYPVSRAGDVNNDGYDDILIGAAQYPSKGAAYVVYGGPKSSMKNIDLSLETLDPHTTGFMITGEAFSDYFGLSLNTAGDINNDGYDDIIVASYVKSFTKGKVYVFYGGPKASMTNIDLSVDTLDPHTTGFTMIGKASFAYFGFSVSTAGDVNRDGYDDMLIGAYGMGGNQGAMYLLYGGEKSSMKNLDFSVDTLDPLTTGFMITGDGASDKFGAPVRIADVNQDGYVDMIVGASGWTGNFGAAYVLYTDCSACCPTHCYTCSGASVCTECDSSYFLYQDQCYSTCPAGYFGSMKKCQSCPAFCSSCASKDVCLVCFPGYTLSNSQCVLSDGSLSSSSVKAQQAAYRAVVSSARGVGSFVCISSSTFPFSTLVSTIVQSTRYLNLSVTPELAEIYQTWDTNLISWDPPNVFSGEDHFKQPPYVFAQYEFGSPFLANYWPTLMNIIIGSGIFFTAIVLRRLFEHIKYEGRVYSWMQKLMAGSFNFVLVQAYACLSDILFYLVLDAKTNPFNSFFSWASMICAVIFLVLGTLLVFFNFWTVKKYQQAKKQGEKELEAFNKRNRYWELLYSDFNDDNFLSQSFFAVLIIRSTFSSLIITVLYDYPLMQVVFLIVLDGAIILFLRLQAPFTDLRSKLMQYYYEIITLLVHLCMFILALQDSFETSSDTVRKIFCGGILYLNTALVGGSLGFMFIEIYDTIRERTKENERKQIMPEESQETQNLTQTVSPLQPPGTDVRKGEQQTIESIYFLPGVSQNRRNLTKYDFNPIESSRAFESNLNGDNSFPSNMDNSSHRIIEATPIIVRHQRRILRPAIKNRSQIVHHTGHIEQSQDDGNSH